MGNTTSDRPLARIQINLKDCFVSHCCVVTSEEEEEEQEQEKEDESLDELDGCISPPHGDDINTLAIKLTSSSSSSSSSCYHRETQRSRSL